MKSAVKQFTSQTLPLLIRRSIITRKERRVKSPDLILRPTEDKISKLNELGKQYPFCISIKQKHHDPL
jgi:hypothetical protein